MSSQSNLCRSWDNGYSVDCTSSVLCCRLVFQSKQWLLKCAVQLEPLSNPSG